MAAFKDHPVSLKDAVAVLAAKRREGFDHVTFTGGEPTLYPRFDRLLALSCKLGYKTYVTTNGNTLAFDSYARKVLPYLDEICFSMHGPDAAVHDGATGDKGSFRLLEKALENLEKLPWNPYVLINFVATKDNIAALPETFAFASRFKKVRHFLVSNLASEGGGRHHYRELAVPLSSIGRAAPELVRQSRATGITLRFFGVPACALGAEYAEYANDFHWSPRATVERKREADGRVGLVEIRGWTPTRGRAQTPRCAPCIYHELCPGVFERYLQEFGDAEIVPIREGAVSESFGRGQPLKTDEESAFWAAKP